MVSDEIGKRAKLISSRFSHFFWVYLEMVLTSRSRDRKNSVTAQFDQVVPDRGRDASDRGIDNAIKNLLLDSLIKSRLFGRVRNYVLKVRRARALSPVVFVYSSLVGSSVSRPRLRLSPRVPRRASPSFPSVSPGSPKADAKFAKFQRNR